MDDFDEQHRWSVEVEGEVKRTVVTEGRFRVRFKRDKYRDIRVEPDSYDDLEAGRSKARLRNRVMRVLMAIATSVAGAAIWHFLL